jgi:hypothetical protein
MRYGRTSPRRISCEEQLQVEKWTLGVKVVGPAEPTGTAIPMKVHKIDQATIASSPQVSHLASQGKTSHPGEQKCSPVKQGTPIKSHSNFTQNKQKH